MAYRLLDAFQHTFQGVQYRHRSSKLGDRVAMELYEDLYALNRSAKLRERIDRRDRILNDNNKRVGVEARRGDGTFGEAIPIGGGSLADPGYIVARGPIATVEIGVEVKILAKAMIKQIDRVCGDLRKQVEHFRKSGGSKAICIGVVGVNHADVYTSYESGRTYPTDGKKYAHPVKEAAQAMERVTREVSSVYDELLFLRFRSTNVPPYPFEWVDSGRTEQEYGAILTRASRLYDDRFGNAG